MTANNEKGASTVEFAFIFGFLMLIALGAFEYGMAFREWQSVTSASREGARVGAAAGDHSQADCRILEAAAGALHGVSGSEVKELWIFQTDPSGTVGNRQIYRPSQPTDDPATLECTTWFPIQMTWDPSSRDNTGETRDWLGVRVVFDHSWQTGFLWFDGTVTWSEDSIMRLDPAKPD